MADNYLEENTGNSWTEKMPSIKPNAVSGKRGWMHIAKKSKRETAA